MTPPMTDRMSTGIGTASTRRLAVARLVEVDSLAPERAAAVLTELVTETYDLVAAHLPEADADRLRAVFAFGREPWPATVEVS